MTIKSTAHAKALSDLVEIISIVGVVVIGVDAAWSIRDGLVNGFNHGLWLITASLLTCFIIAGVAVTKYHYKQYNGHLKEILKIKLRHCKLAGKHS